MIISTCNNIFLSMIISTVYRDGKRWWQKFVFFSGDNQIDQLHPKDPQEVELISGFYFSLSLSLSIFLSTLDNILLNIKKNQKESFSFNIYCDIYSPKASLTIEASGYSLFTFNGWQNDDEYYYYMYHGYYYHFEFCWWTIM